MSGRPAGRALVTGGARRLGRAMALALAERGYDVAVHYATSVEDAEETTGEIAGIGRRTAALRADLLDEAQATALVGRAAEALGGPLTVLVNNASIFEPDTLQDASADSWSRHFGSNLRAPFLLTQAFAAGLPQPAPRDAGQEAPPAPGLIVNMVDHKVLNLTADFMTYTLAKAGLWTLTQTSAQALAPRIRVNAIGPGPTLIGARQGTAHFAAQRLGAPLERGADPSDVVSALTYLLDAPAVTGQILMVDGGRHLARD